MIERSLIILLVALALVGCGGPALDLSTPDPPSAAPYEQEANPAVDDLLIGIDSGVQELLEMRGYAPEEPPKIYSSSMGVAEIVQFYDGELIGKRGWETLPNGLPDTPTRALLAYQKGDTLLVVTAIDIAAYNGTGIVIYTLKASR